MRSFLTFLKEELDPQQKADVDAWGTNEAAVKISKHIFPEGQDRLVLPVSTPHDHDIEPLEHIHKALTQHGYKIQHYVQGKVIEPKYGREVKMGKALNSIDASGRLLHDFNNDQRRAGAKRLHGDLDVVISRHPYDVAGMSTNREWTSCMEMGKGINQHYLKHDIRQGTHVAYLVKRGDHTIQNPIARIALKPFKAADGSNHTILSPEHTQYGTGSDAFSETVNNWTKEHFPLKDKVSYEKKPQIYDDSDRKVLINPTSWDDNNPDDVAHAADLPRLHRFAFSEHNMPNIHAATLRNEWSNHPNYSLFENIAKHQNPKTLDIMVTHPNTQARQLVAQYGTDEHKQKLVNDSDSFVRAHLARHANENITSKLLEQIKSSGGLNVRDNENIGYEMATNPNEKVVHKILDYMDSTHSHSDYVLGGAASSKHDSVHKRLMNFPLNRIRGVVAIASKNPELLDKLSQDPSEYVRARTAINGVHLHTKLIEDPSSEVREMVAIHSRDPEIQSKLLSDPSEHVRTRLAMNAEDHVRHHLINDKDDEVRIALARHAGPQIKHALVKDRNADVRERVALYGTKQHRKLLVNDPSEKVRRAVASDSSFHHDLVNDPSEDVRTIVAESNDPKIHEKLMSDPSEIVRNSVIWAAGPKILSKMASSETDYHNLSDIAGRINSHLNEDDESFNPDPHYIHAATNLVKNPNAMIGRGLLPHLFRGHGDKLPEAAIHTFIDRSMNEIGPHELLNNLDAVSKSPYASVHEKLVNIPGDHISLLLSNPHISENIPKTVLNTSYKPSHLNEMLHAKANEVLNKMKEKNANI